MSEDGFTRRSMLGRAGSTLFLASAVRSDAATQTDENGPAPSHRIVDVRTLGADPSGARDSAPAIQRAIDQLAPTGGIIYLPGGQYRISHTLNWQNPENARAPGLSFQGDSMHSTVLVSDISSGPLLRVRGVRSRAPVDTSFFWGGGIRDLTIKGNDGPDTQHGIEVLGWYYGEIQNCRFTALGGDAIRAIVDLGIDPNPDFTSSTLFVRGVWFERIGGWGFRDLSAAQGAPAWSWDRCSFIFCRKGGAQVRSGGHGFTKCSFAICGWRSESDTPVATAYGLLFDGAATACSQHFIEGCEFDGNLTAHIGARFLAASSFLNNRFIFSDHFNAGRGRPTVAVAIGIGDVNACVLGVQFRQSFFRFDLPGSTVGFDFVNSANVRDIEIGGSVFTIPAGANVTRFRGEDPGGRGEAYGFVVHRGARE